MPEQKEKRTLLLLYILAAYILFQVAWWGYLLAKANLALSEEGGSGVRKVWMIVGEGSVFLVLLLTGFLYVRRTVLQELRLARMQRTFLLSVTHELKTPIAAIKLFIETLRSRDLPREQAHQLLADALRETHRLQGLSENILLATRLDTSREKLFPESVDLAPLVHTECTRFRQLFPSHRLLEEVSAEILISGERELLRAVLFNLLENAGKYSPAGSEVRVRLFAEKEMAILEVIDEGPGIPVQEQSRIFEKFYRLGNEATRRHKGTGLGLYIVRNCIRLHKGTISILNNEPTGAIFRAELPMIHE